MYNLPVKFSLLSTPYEALSPQVFLDRSPEACLAVYKSLLPRHARQVVEFAFSDQAILLILEHELTVPVSHPQLLFTKPHLDAESWLLANGYARSPELSLDGEARIEAVAHALWLQTAVLSSTENSLLDRVALQRELKAVLALYCVKYGASSLHALQPLESAMGIQRFFSLLVAEAIYKADGARVLFGARSGYYQAWLAAQLQYLTFAQHLSRLPLAQSA